MLVAASCRWCTPVVLFRRSGPGGAAAEIGRWVRVGRAVRGPRPWRKSRVEGAETRNEWGPDHGLLLALGETNRTGEAVPRVPEKPEAWGSPGGICPLMRGSGLVTV